MSMHRAAPGRVLALAAILCLGVVVTQATAQTSGQSPADTPPHAAPQHSPAGLAYRAQPLTSEIYFADPAAHVFEGRVYVYGSHDVDGPAADEQPGRGYVMRDYRVLSMDSIGGLVTVGPVAFTLADVPWADRQLWAPDAAFKDGRYYLYFPAKDADGVFRIGVAVGER
ncbi:MAG: glycosyl hydrolase 43 family protein, partial [Brevundimonas sp.]|nr:glycosyl hydrolase 43 family protein [Brevundimonas sp.]